VNLKKISVQKTEKQLAIDLAEKKAVITQKIKQEIAEREV